MSDVRLGSKEGSAAKNPGESAARSGSRSLRTASRSPESSALSDAAAPVGRRRVDERVDGLEAARAEQRPGAVG